MLLLLLLVYFLIGFSVKVKNDLGDIDILVNNAGIVTGKKFLECPDSLIQKTMDVNATAHFWVGRNFL